jgi:hypothetical protein
MKAWDAYRPKEFGMGVRDFFLIFNVKLRVVIFPVKKMLPILEIQMTIQWEQIPKSPCNSN